MSLGRYIADRDPGIEFARQSRKIPAIIGTRKIDRGDQAGAIAALLLYQLDCLRRIERDTCRAVARMELALQQLERDWIAIDDQHRRQGAILSN